MICYIILAVISYFTVGVYTARIAYRNPYRRCAAQYGYDFDHKDMATACFAIWPVVGIVKLVMFLVELLVNVCIWAITVNNKG